MEHHAPQADLSRLAEQQFEAVRHALAERRRQLGLSMSELARQIGVSPSMVSQMERGQTLPSVATLFALAAALGATLDAFFQVPAEGDGAAGAREVEAEPSPAGTREQLYVVRRHGRAGVDIRGGVRWERLTPVSLDEADFLELIYEPGAESAAELYRHPGIEMVLVLAGTFEITIGFERYRLEPGDSITFPSSIPHRYRNPGATTARAATAILRQPFAGTSSFAHDHLLVGDGR